MKQTFSLIKIGLFLVVAGLVFLGVFGGLSAYRSTNVDVLFDGPTTFVPRETPQYYPAARYQVSGSGGAGAPLWELHTDESDAPAAPEKNTVPRLASANNIIATSPIEPAFVEQEDRSPDALQLRLPSVYRDRRPYRSLQIVHPEDGSLFPPNLCAPYVEWEDPVNNLWMVCIQAGSNAGLRTWSFVSEYKRWRFSEAVWEEIRNLAITEDAQLSIKGIQRVDSGQKIDAIQVSEIVRFRVSSDPADDYIVFRIVPPPFSTKKTPNIYIRDIRQDNNEIFLSSRQQYCINCHTFSSRQGDIGKLSVQVRCMNDSRWKLKTYLALYDLRLKKGKKIKLPFDIQMTTFMAWSPDGNKLAFSANQKLATLYPITYETQLASTETADLAIYDDEREIAYLLPGASEPGWLENYPTWSPDGKTLVFTRAPAGGHPAALRYGLAAVDFDEEGVSNFRLIDGASGGGHSHVFPRYSPDGKWFSFTQCDGGDLIRSSSDLYLLSGDLSGPARLLECNVPYAADSWHSWSSNSRWIVFASKRMDGTYAYLYLTHIDEDGRASPAVRLPEESPPLASYNIPEFCARRPPVSDRELFESLRVEQEPISIQPVEAPGANRRQL